MRRRRWYWPWRCACCGWSCRNVVKKRFEKIALVEGWARSQSGKPTHRGQGCCVCVCTSCDTAPRHSRQSPSKNVAEWNQCASRPDALPLFQRQHLGICFAIGRKYSHGPPNFSSGMMLSDGKSIRIKCCTPCILLQYTLDALVDGQDQIFNADAAARGRDDNVVHLLA